MTIGSSWWSFNQVCKVYEWLYESEFKEKTPTDWKDIPKNIYFFLELHSKNYWLRLIRKIPTFSPRNEKRCLIKDCPHDSRVDGLCKVHWNRRYATGMAQSFDEILDQLETI